MQGAHAQTHCGVVHQEDSSSRLPCQKECEHGLPQRRQLLAGVAGAGTISNQGTLQPHGRPPMSAQASETEPESDLEQEEADEDEEEEEEDAALHKHQPEAAPESDSDAPASPERKVVGSAVNPADTAPAGPSAEVRYRPDI